MVGKQSGELVVDEQGVEITKRLEPAEYVLPSVEFAIESERSDTVAVRLVDPVPEEADVRDIGFHPEHGEEHWSVESDRVIFEHEFRPGDGCYTLYGIGGEEPDLQSFLVEPAEIAIERNATDADESVSLVEEIPDVEDDDDEDDEYTTSERTSEPTTLTLDDAAEDDSTNDAIDNDRLPGAGDTMEHDTASVLDALVTEIKKRESTDEQLETLRQTLQLRNGSIDARLTQLQTEVTELGAYTNALEEFLDENGTGAELINGFDDRLHGIETVVDELQATVSSHNGEFESVGESIDELQSALEAAHEQMEAMQAELGELESQVSDVQAEIPDGDLSAELNEVQTDVSELRDWQDQVITAFGSALDEPVEAEN